MQLLHIDDIMQQQNAICVWNVVVVIFMMTMNKSKENAKL